MPHITENIENVAEILGIYKGKSPVGELLCKNRHSDCLVYVLSGNGVYHFGCNEVTSEPGSIIYLARNSRYRKIVTNTDFTHIHIDFNFTNSDKIQFDNHIFKHEILKKLEGDFLKMRSLWLAGTVSDKAECMSLLYGIYSRIIESTVMTYLSEPQRKSIECAVNIINEHISDPGLSVSYLSNRLNMSEVHLRRLFVKIHKASPVKYITGLRISSACEMLKGTNKEIAAIAEECGFSSGYYFSRVFKNETGMSPSNYRKIMSET